VVLPGIGSSIVAAEACLLRRLRLFVDFANVGPSLAVGAELVAVVRLLVTTPSVAEFVEFVNDGGNIRYLGRRLGADLASNASLEDNIDVTSDGVVPATVFTVSYRTHDLPEQSYRT
jgi:hypothetical protein